MLAGFMSGSVKAINKPVFPAVCLPVPAEKKTESHKGKQGEQKSKFVCKREGIPEPEAKSPPW